MFYLPDLPNIKKLIYKEVNNQKLGHQSVNLFYSEKLERTKIPSNRGIFKQNLF